MKIQEAIKNPESSILINLRKFLATSPSDCVYSVEEIAEKIGASRTSVRDFGQREEFSLNRHRRGHRFWYGSKKGILCFKEAIKNAH